MTPAEQREMRRLRRQRDALFDRLVLLVDAGKLGVCPGMNYAEIHREEIRRAERLVRRVRAARTNQP